MRTMYDAVTAANITKAYLNPQLVAGYIDKIRLEPWSAADWALFPNARKVEIVKKASTNAGHVLDVEPGDATPAQAPGWAAMRRRAGFAFPVIYGNRSTWPAVRWSSSGRAPLRPVLDRHRDRARRDPRRRDRRAVPARRRPGIDVSVVADYWPGVDPAPGPNTGGGGSAGASTVGVELMDRITVTPKNDGVNTVRVNLSGTGGAAIVVARRSRATARATRCGSATFTRGARTSRASATPEEQGRLQRPAHLASADRAARRRVGRRRVQRRPRSPVRHRLLLTRKDHHERVQLPRRARQGRDRADRRGRAQGQGASTAAALVGIARPSSACTSSTAQSRTGPPARSAASSPARRRSSPGGWPSTPRGPRSSRPATTRHRQKRPRAHRARGPFRRVQPRTSCRLCR